MTFTRILTLLCLSFYATCMFAQTEETSSDSTRTKKRPKIVTNRSFNDGFDVTMPQFTPKAPNVAGLISAIDIPVSLYTGIPDISIPIYEIDAGEVKIPITLSYHASGIRVVQEASWVGLGWSLNVGGVVSRTIKCGDDFYEVDQPYIHEGYYTETGIEMPRENGYFQYYYYNGEFFQGKNKLVKDSEPDIFYYTMPQCSGKFILKQSDGPVLLDPTSGGRTILERRDGSNDTYFVYNPLGLLRYVLPPQYQQEGKKALYGYEYRYDSRRRVVKKILPGCGTIQYWYDKGDRLMFMRDDRLTEAGRYRFYFYDHLGRLCIQGTCTDCNRGSYHGFVSYSASAEGLCDTG